MRVAHFIFTCFLSTFIMLSADVKHILPMYTIAAALWFLYGIRQAAYNRRRRARMRRYELQTEYYLMQLYRHGYQYNRPTNKR